MRNLLMAVIALTIIMSIVSFVLMKIDKKRARERKWRIPERTLFLAAGCFGAIGGTIVMKLFHHKTNHWYFKTFFPAMMVVQIAILAYLAFRVFG